MQENRGTGIKK